MVDRRRGRASRQARSASVRGTSNAPTATSRSPFASPTTCAGTPAAAARPSTAATWSGETDTTTRDVDSPKHASAGGAAGAEREVDAEPDLAAERHLAQRDREPAVAHVVHAGDLALAHELGDELVQRACRVEIGDRRHAAVETVHDRGPLRTAELGPRRAEHDDRRRPRAARARGGASSSSSMRPSTPTTGVGWMSAPRDAL